MGAAAVSPHRTRTLWLLRHAKTVADPPPGGSDFDRILAPRGRRDAQALGHLLAGLLTGDSRQSPDGVPLGLAEALPPQVALVSAAVRTAATAEMVLAQLPEPPDVQLLDVLYGAAPRDVIALLQDLPDEIGSAMVVGHNPTAHALAAGLPAPGDEAGRSLTSTRGFSTCALGVYCFDTPHWAEVREEGATLVALVRPPY